MGGQNVVVGSTYSEDKGFLSYSMVWKGGETSWSTVETCSAPVSVDSMAAASTGINKQSGTLSEPKKYIFSVWSMMKLFFYWPANVAWTVQGHVINLRGNLVQCSALKALEKSPLSVPRLWQNNSNPQKNQVRCLIKMRYTCLFFFLWIDAQGQVCCALWRSVYAVKEYLSCQKSNIWSLHSKNSFSIQRLKVEPGLPRLTFNIPGPVDIKMPHFQSDFTHHGEWQEKHYELNYE